jgi:Holliday junction resolvase RusA-like endonuclease|tara:strand:- start:339 stop:851 length:513 start_codon:yes stop_codon:yes gene_type:complete
VEISKVIQNTSGLVLLDRTARLYQELQKGKKVMDNPIIFNIAPVVASRPRVTRWGTYFAKKYSNFREEFAELLSDYKAIPVSGLLSVRLDFYVQLPKSMSNKKKLEKEGKHCDNNADIDNYVKATLDSLEGHYYDNDKQIVIIRARKYWSDNGRIEFDYRELEGEELVTK